MSIRNLGILTWEGSRDGETHRDYDVTYLVQCNEGEQIGPHQIMNSSVLPQMGDLYAIGGDTDNYAYCHPDMKISLKDAKDGELGVNWKVQMKFSTRAIERCMNGERTDPTTEPQKVSGSFVKFTQEYRYDRFGNFVTNSALEPIRGPDSEFDANRPTVRIEQNRYSLDLSTLANMVDTVNNSPLWGLPKRCIKLSDVTWERKIYGKCSFYFTRTFNFDINYNTFDRAVGDFGTMVLKGQWNQTTKSWAVDPTADRNNPQHFMKYTDIIGNTCPVVLNGYGLPAGTTATIGTGTSGSATGPEGQLLIQHYYESDFTQLGIPTDLTQSL